MRNITRYNGEPLSDQEKINDAMNTAKTHMDRARVLQDMILCYMNDNLKSLQRTQEMLYQ